MVEPKPLPAGPKEISCIEWNIKFAVSNKTLINNQFTLLSHCGIKNINCSEFSISKIWTLYNNRIYISSFEIKTYHKKFFDWVISIQWFVKNKYLRITHLSLFQYWQICNSEISAYFQMPNYAPHSIPDIENKKCQQQNFPFRYNRDSIFHRVCLYFRIQPRHLFH